MGICNTLFTELALEISDAPRPVASAGYNFLRWFAGVIAPYAVPKIAEFCGVEVAFAVAAAAALAAPLTFYLRRHHLARPSAEAAPAPVSPLLVAVDGGPSDAAVVDRAAALARAGGRPVLVVHVRMAEVIDEEEADLEDTTTAAAIIGLAVERLTTAGIAAKGQIIDATAGAAARKVSELADALAASRIVVGAPHRHDPEDIRHGSFSAALLTMRGPDGVVVVGDRREVSSKTGPLSALSQHSA